jgi:hypothetical protein
MRKRNWFFALVMALMGTMVLLNSLGSPRMEASGLHGSDILRLVASGGLFGVAIMVLTASRWAKKE